MIRIHTGEIRVGSDLKRTIYTPYLNGRVEKVIIKFGQDNSDSMVTLITTSDEENIMSIQGSKDGIWYPRNWDVQQQKYTGNTVAADQSNPMNAERHVCLGRLRIDVEAENVEDFIKDIMFILDGQIIQEEYNPDIEKGEGMVTTNTAGVYNPRYNSSRRKRYIKQFINVCSQEIIQKKDFLVKSDKGDSFIKFIEDALFDKTFEGLNQTDSEKIKDYMLRSVVKGYDQERIRKYLTRLIGANATKQVENIMRTENHVLRNKIREWNYKQLEGDEEFKYKWIGPKDHRTTKICKNITSRSSSGVSMDKLKSIISDEVDKAKSRGELPSNFDPREYNPHFMCRHTFIRAFD